MIVMNHYLIITNDLKAISTCNIKLMKKKLKHKKTAHARAKPGYSARYFGLYQIITYIMERIYKNK